MFLDSLRSHSLPHPSPIIYTFSFPTSCVFLLFKKFNTRGVLSVLLVCTWVQSHLLEHGQPLRCSILEENQLSPSSCVSSIASQIVVGIHEPLPHPYWDLALACFCARLVHSHSCWEFMCATGPSRSENACVTRDIYFLSLLQSFHFQSLGEMRCVTDVPLRVERSTVSCSLQ